MNYENLVGKKFSQLNENELENIVVFLDIDDTLGKAIDIVEEDVDKSYNDLYDDCLPKYRLAYTVFVSENIYHFCYYTKTLYGQWKRIHVFFEIRNSLKDFIKYLDDKNITNIYLLSAASSEYIEGVLYILQYYCYFDVKGYVSVSTVQQRNIVTTINGKLRTVLYMEKDMELAKYELYVLPNKIPILFDDKPFWAKNGYVIPIKNIDTLGTYIDTPIQMYKEPLFVIYEYDDQELNYCLI